MRALEPKRRTAHLPGQLLQLVLPALVYIPLCNGSDRFARIVRIPIHEGKYRVKVQSCHKAPWYLALTTHHFLRVC